MRNNKSEFNLWGDWNVCTFELLWLFFGKEVVFSKTYPSFLTLKEGSTSHLDLLPSGKKRETALLGARNRYALRLAGHQSPRHVLRDGTAGRGKFIVNSLHVYATCLRTHIIKHMIISVICTNMRKGTRFKSG